MTKAKITNLHKITRHGKQIGRINLVKYNNFSINHIEYDLDEKHRNKGIMSKELSKYIKAMRKEGIHKFFAVIERDNEASIKLVEKNKFIRFSISEDFYYYLATYDLIDKAARIRKEFIKHIGGL